MIWKIGCADLVEKLHNENHKTLETDAQMVSKMLQIHLIFQWTLLDSSFQSITNVCWNEWVGHFLMLSNHWHFITYYLLLVFQNLFHLIWLWFHETCLTPYFQLEIIVIQSKRKHGSIWWFFFAVEINHWSDTNWMCSATKIKYSIGMKTHFNYFKLLIFILDSNRYNQHNCRWILNEKYTKMTKLIFFL